MARHILKVAVVILLCVLISECSGERQTKIDADALKRSVRNKRWLWGGCGLIPSCDQCSDSRICKKCSTQYVPIEYVSYVRIVRCTRKCPVGYNVTTTKEYRSICVRIQKGCDVSHCDSCHPRSPQSCLNCTSGFYALRLRIRGKVTCVRQCPVGYTAGLKSDGTHVCKSQHTKCRAVIPNCGRCLDSVSCRKCKDGFFAFFNVTSMRCLPRCPSDYNEANSMYFGKYCEKKSVFQGCVTVPHCERCPKRTGCRRCKSGYLKIKTRAFDNTTCVASCPKGFERQGKKCRRRSSEEGCSDEFCLQCKVGWYRQKVCRRCPRVLPKVRQTRRKLCFKCQANCDKCRTAKRCDQCTAGSFKMTQGDRTSCVQQCPPEYKLHRTVKAGSECIARKARKT